MAHNHMTLRQCVQMAGDLIDSKAAYNKLETFIAATKEAAA